MIKAYPFPQTKVKARAFSCRQLFILVGLLIISLSVLSACSSSYSRSSDKAESESIRQTLEKEWGVKLISINLTATDYMLDFRYRVTDPEKAAAIINRKTKPYLIVEKTGVILKVPSSYKVGPLRQSAQFAQPDKNYFMLFANPGRHVKEGDLVTVVAGDFKLEHLIVQ